MIVGIGTDLCDVRRIEAALQRHGLRFVERILGPQERVVWAQRSGRCAQRGLRYLATRFAAKEAFSKAIGLGLRAPMRWRDCEILHQPSGQPAVVLHGALQRWCAERGWHAQVSVSDDGDWASACVIVEARNAPARAPLASSADTATPMPDEGEVRRR
ncbi:holo-ACP synthase [Tepidimonas charontis]|uniref:Holo-[acyl-carrier-protein] synthase n=1 Tax=Tepidimonas charontis TaxID=2267262 RepID=A0A554XJP7_9BURK|nr:holo-ACP synthase [Tepidimonas charontis]TSE36052.1 Holo-acyl-carrier-protein synthase [Tepidimonas charontis]